MLSSDSDGDTLLDGFETEIGTNPIEPDSDFDQIDDYSEIYIYFTDPTNRDMAVVLVLSKEEQIEIDIGLLKPVISTSSRKHPEHETADADGLNDGFEISKGMNPLSPDSDNDSLGDFFEVLNGLDPLSGDSDGDGWGDAYEVEYCLSPTNPDTDFDGIPDGIDWDPREHWISMLAPVAMFGFALLALTFGLLKHRIYFKKSE